MPKTRTIPEDSSAERATRATSSSPDGVRDIADALCRAADECYHQHGRSARLIAKTSVDAEERCAQRLCSVCDETLEQLAVAYERSAASIRLNGGDEDWWHRANALWLASREYARRHKSCDAQTRRLPAHHSPTELEALHLEFELEASSLLALRQACEAYYRARPQAR